MCDPFVSLDVPLALFRRLDGGFVRFLRAPRHIGQAKPNQPVLFGIGHRVMRNHLAHHVNLGLHGCLFGVGPVDSRVGTRAPVEHAPSLHFRMISLSELILVPNAGSVNEPLRSLRMCESL